MSSAISVAHGEFGRAALYEMDRPMVTHAHREGHLIFHVQGDPSTVVIGDTTIPSDSNTVVAVSPWAPHSFQSTAESPSLILVLYIKPLWFLEINNTADYALRFGSCRVQMVPAIEQLSTRLTGVLLNDSASTEVDGLLYSLTLACFERSWAERRDEGLFGYQNRFNDFRVRRSLRIMQENMTEDFEMERLARSVGLSRPHFFKLFRQQMGVTPNIYLNTLRSEQAIDDLVTTQKSVTDIALDLGFSSQASFTRFFSSNVGIAPSEYRRVSHVADEGIPMLSQ